MAVWLALFIVGEKVANYQWENQYSNSWSLADKSSTIEAKSMHIDKFIELLEAGNAKGDFASHDALFMKTPNNSFENNLNALKTLSSRLHELKDMDPDSFQYNTAIQQITQQEQGEAQAMMNVIGNCWCLANYPIVWGWILNTLVGAWIITGVVALYCFLVYNY